MKKTSKQLFQSVDYDPSEIVHIAQERYLKRKTPENLILLKDAIRFKQLSKSYTMSGEDPKVANLKYKLSLCGRYVTKNFYCKKEEHSGNTLLKTIRSRFSCEIRYCAKPICAIQRFARTVETMKEISRFWGLEKLWHFVIGFEAIPEKEFKQNFSKYNKRFQYILNKYFEKLRKNGLNIEAVRVLDFSFKTEGMVYLHYHFGAVPIGKQNIRSSMILMQKVRKDMIKNMRIKTPFHFEDFGLAKKDGVLSYLSIRASGMYKWDTTENPNYKIKKSKLKETIKAKKYIFLKNVLTEEEYLNSFYNKPFFVTIGGIPRPLRHGSNITDGIPKECSCCGPLERSDIHIEVIFDPLDEKPPDPRKPYPELKIEVVKI